MEYMPRLASDTLRSLAAGLAVGYDLVQISQIEESMREFGDLFTRRLFTEHEIEHARSGVGMCAQRLAARFAAKEATIKALKLSNAGVGWREIEVRRLHDGDCELALHGRVAQLAHAMGVAQILLSLSHDGDYAGAMVTVLFAPHDSPSDSAPLS
ncbi:MAG: Holo-[acyl-carrier-protein] synthase [Burkholderiaceae bacterium]|jgi:holo-[acyl-carrier protein] synthase|nr:MAG: Holo-[acyl-carrier-protein] synthase [Burkholderiaceae bacterium]